jgi:hypothetical protein
VEESTQPAATGQSLADPDLVGVWVDDDIRTTVPVD